MQQPETKTSVGAVPKGTVAAPINENVSRLNICCVCKSHVNKLKQCSDCKSSKYCSKRCQNKHFKKHKEICRAIVELNRIQAERVLGHDYTVTEPSLEPSYVQNLIRLIGSKPLISCKLDIHSQIALWDTGSMVSMVSRDWLDKQLPNAEVCKLEQFMGNEKLDLRAANNSNISLDGIVLIDVRLNKNSEPVKVPFIVTNEQLSHPILGYNLIEHIIITNNESSVEFIPNLPSKSVQAVVTLIQERARAPDMLGEAKVYKNTVIPANSRINVKCKASKITGVTSKDKSVLVTPIINLYEDRLVVSESYSKVLKGKTPFVSTIVVNPTNQEIILRKGEVIGTVHSVSAVIPLELQDPLEKLHQEKDKLSQTDHKETNSPDTRWSPNVDLCHLSPEKKRLVEQMLYEESEVFSKSDADIGDIKDFQMEIDLTDREPVNIPYRSIPKQLYEEVKNYVDDLVMNGWVKQSKSAYASPMVCVRKKDGSLRLCIDYRKLNSKTIADRQPIPRIQEILDSLGGQKYFTTLDMSKAYHQGYIKEDSRKYTAFSTPWSLYEWIRIPFGLKNAPASFQRYINECLKGLRDLICIAYLDDILCYSKTFEQHLENVRTVLCRLKQSGVKVRAEKCDFFKEEVKYLGTMVSEKGYRPDPSNIEALEKFREPPKTVGDLRKLLGFLGYYRKFVRDFSRKLKPVYDLLQKPVKGVGRKQKHRQLDSRTKISWSNNLQLILDEMIDCLQSPNVMSFPDFKLPFIVTCDASAEGLGAVLYQNQDGVNRVISYASRTLTEAERNYHMHSGKLEFLALKWAVTERFSDYLSYGPSFTVYTDNNPLTYVMTSAKLNASGLRWVAELSHYNFIIKYRPGKKNIDADYLSRNSLDLEKLIKHCTVEISPENIKILNSVGDNVITTHNVSVNHLQLNDLKSKAPVAAKQLSEEQQNDPIISPVYNAVASGIRPKKEDWKMFGRKTKLLLQQFNKLFMKDNVLLRKTEQYNQIILPTKYHRTVYRELHDNMAHLGTEKVLDLARKRFYWPYMAGDIDHYIRRQCECTISKQPNIKERAPLVPMEATYPFQLVSIDYIQLDRCKGGFEYVLVVSDYFTKFVQLYGTKNKSSKSAANKLFNEFILQYGFPQRIHHDRGGEFNSILFKKLHELSGIKSSNTSPYHPMGDGQVERMNRTLVNMLKTLSSKEKDNWKIHLPKLAFAYNSTINKSTGYSPFFLLFGRHSRLPIDSMFDINSNDSREGESYSKFVTEWENSMKTAREIANKNIQQSTSYNKQYYDKKAKSVEIEVGDNVLVKNVKRKGKLCNYWESEIYEVKEKDDRLPVYTIYPVKGGKTRKLHRNLLKKCNELLTFSTNPVPAPRPASTLPTLNQRQTITKFVPVIGPHQKPVPAPRPASTLPTLNQRQTDTKLVPVIGPHQKPVPAPRPASTLPMLNQHQSITKPIPDPRSVSTLPTSPPPPPQVDFPNDVQSTSSSSEEDEEESRFQSRFPSRIRRAPRVFTYDVVGKPTINKIEL